MHIPPTVTTLANGLRIVTYYKPNQKLCVALSVNVGSLVETPEENGLTHFVEHMLFKGTDTRTAVDISGEIEITGADMNAFTSYDMTTYYVDGLAETSDTALSVLSDMLLNSVFDPDSIASEQDVVCQEIAMYLDNMPDRARNGLHSVAFTGQPAARPIIGNEDNVRSFNQTKIQQFVRQNYNSTNIVVSGIGDIEHDDFVARVEKYFAHVVPGTKTNVVEKSDYVGGFFKYSDNSREQAVAILAYPLPKDYTRNELRKFNILAGLLGGGMSSPLFQEVREERGLCYSVGASTVTTSAGALFGLSGSTSKAQLEEMVLVAKGELQKIADGHINPDDLQRAKNSTKIALLNLEDELIDIAAYVSRDIFEEREFKTSSEIMSEINAFTLADMQSAAKYLLDQKPSLSITGDVPDIEWIEGV